MAVPLKKQELKQQNTTSEEVKYLAFENNDSDNIAFQELLFFVRLSSFSVITVLSCFVLLVNGLTPAISIPLGVLIGAGITITLAFLLDLLKR